MTNTEEKRLNRRRFYKAEQEASFVEAHITSTPQTRDPAYRLAFRDTDFLLREELRPVRFQLELLKCEMLLEEAGIGSTFVCYGSARIPEPGMSAAAATPEDAVRAGRGGQQPGRQKACDAPHGSLLIVRQKGQDVALLDGTLFDEGVPGPAVAAASEPFW